MDQIESTNGQILEYHRYMVWLRAPALYEASLPDIIDESEFKQLALLILYCYGTNIIQVIRCATHIPFNVKDIIDAIPYAYHYGMTELAKQCEYVRDMQYPSLNFICQRELDLIIEDTIRQDMLRLFESGMFADAHLISNEGDRIPIHLDFVIQKSRELAIPLVHYQESASREFHLDASTEAIYDLMRYVYGDVKAITDDEVKGTEFEVMELALKFNMGGLYDAYRQYFKDNKHLFQDEERKYLMDFFRQLKDEEMVKHYAT